MTDEEETLKSIMVETIKILFDGINDTQVRTKCVSHLENQISELGCSERCIVICDETNNNANVIDDCNFVINLVYQTEEQKSAGFGQITKMRASAKPLLEPL